MGFSYRFHRFHRISQRLVKQVTISLSEAVFWMESGTLHRSLRSLCVVLTINQRLRRCVKEFDEGVDRMCRELSAIGTKEPLYHLVAFIMKASVWANVLDKGQENIPSNQAGFNTAQKAPKNYPKTTQKQSIVITPTQKGIIDFLILHPYAGRKEIASNLGSLSEDGVKYNLKVLQQKGIIKRIGPTNGGYWKVLIDETSDK